MLVVAVIMVARNARKMQLLVAEIRRDEITPLVVRANHALDEVQSVISRVQTYEDDVRRAVGRAGDRVQQVSHFVRAGSLPFLGILRGATAAFSILVNGRSNSRATGAGGTGHARY